MDGGPLRIESVPQNSPPDCHMNLFTLTNDKFEQFSLGPYYADQLKYFVFTFYFVL